MRLIRWVFCMHRIFRGYGAEAIGTRILRYRQTRAQEFFKS